MIAAAPYSAMPVGVLVSLMASLLLSFFLSGLESAILSVSPARLRHEAKEGDRKALRIESLLTRRELLLGSILLVNVSLNLMAFVVIVLRTVAWFGAWGWLVAFAVSLPIYLIWVELLPKAIFKRTPLRLLCIFLPLIVAVDVTVRPLFQLLAWPFQLLAERFADSGSAPTPGGERAEFRALTEILEREGHLPPRETRLIRAVLDFQQIRVEELMLPLSKVTAVPQDMPVSSVITLARQTRFDQFPLMAQNGDLVGVIDVPGLLRDQIGTGPAKQHAHKLVRSQPGDSAIAVIRRLRRAGHQIAAVCPQGGRPIGIVSLADLVDRMVHETPAGAA